MKNQEMGYRKTKFQKFLGQNELTDFIIILVVTIIGLFGLFLIRQLEHTNSHEYKEKLLATVIVSSQIIAVVSLFFHKRNYFSRKENKWRKRNGLRPFDD